MSLADYLEDDDDYDMLDFQLFDDELVENSHSQSYSSDSSSDNPLTSFARDRDAISSISKAPKKRVRLGKRRRSPHLKDTNGQWVVNVHLPRIPKNDVRRSYGIMFTNVYNSGNEAFMNNFVDTFITDEYSFVFLKNNITQRMCGPKAVLSAFWFDRMHESPDVHFGFSASRIKVRSDGTAVLTGNFSLFGTKVVCSTKDERHFLLKDQDECEYQKLKRQLSHTSTSTGPIASSADQEVPEVTQMTVLYSSDQLKTEDTVFIKPKIYRFGAEGSLSLHINARRQIETLEMAVFSEQCALLSG